MTDDGQRMVGQQKETFRMVPEHQTSPTMIQQKVDATLWIDTHEHLIEESRRFGAPAETDPFFPCDDWAYLFHHYARDDLHVAGMRPEAMSRLFSPSVDPADKWELFEPIWPRIRHTGYGRAVRITVRELFGEEDITRDNVIRITDRMRQGVQPGFYRRILKDVAGIECCQVNSLEHTFCQTAQPDLLYQDISTVHLGSSLDVDRLRRETALPVRTLEECHQAIQWYFDRYGAQAVATKNQSAYQRRLNYDHVWAEDAGRLFQRHVSGTSPLEGAELKALQDHLARFCISQAANHNLPVKLHTGYYAGSDAMPLERVSMNLKDLCPLLEAFPSAHFVLMHIAYPYHDELVALVKHYRNVYADLCWAWIVNPLATKQFVKEFLLAAPSNKLLAFGGDYYSVENVVGHARIARQGLGQALDELVAEGWLSETEALDMVEPLMRGNAQVLFDMNRKADTARHILALRSAQQALPATPTPVMP